MTKHHVIESVQFSGDTMRLRVDGQEYWRLQGRIFNRDKAA